MRGNNGVSVLQMERREGNLSPVWPPLFFPSFVVVSGYNSHPPALYTHQLSYSNPHL